MALGGGSLAGVARVAFEAQTGEFQADISRAEAIYRNATHGMSDDAIRLELAQDKLRRALAKGPGAFREQARAELELRRISQGLRTDTDHLGRSMDRTQRSADRFGRGALAGSGALRGLGRNLAFASAGFLGGTGLVYGMRTAINVASSLEEQTNKVSVVFRESGAETVEWSRQTATSMGIAQDQALSYVGTLGGIFNSSGIVRSESAKLSRQIVELAADMASFNDATPEETLQALRSGLVGEVEPLRRFAVLLSEAAVAQEALRQTGKTSKDELTAGEKVLARYSLILKQTGDQQGDFARTSEGLANSQRTLSALWRDAQGIVGQALAPAFTEAVQGLRDWLDEDKNRIAIQREVNAAVETGEKVIRGFASGLELIVAAGKPIVALLGGIEKAAEVALILGVARKLGIIRLGFGGIGAASGATRNKIVADAVAEVAALNSVSVAAGRAGLAVGGIGAGGVGRGLGRAGAARFVPGVGTVLTGALIADALTGGKGSAAVGKFFDENRGTDMGPLRQAARKGTFTGADLARARQFLTDSQFSELRNIIATRLRRQSSAGAELPGERAEGAAGVPQRPLTRGGRGGGRNRFNFADVERGFTGFAERDIDVQTTEGTSDDAKLARDRLALANRALRELKLTRDQRLRVKQERLNALQELGRIEQEEEQAVQAIRDKAQAAAQKRRAAHEKAVETARKEREDAKKREEARQRAEERAFDEFERRTRARDMRRNRGRDPLSGFGGGLGSALTEAKKGRGKTATSEEKGMTVAQMQAEQFKFLGSLQGVMNEAAGNLLPGSAPNPDSFRMANELERQTHILSSLSSSARSPGTRYARTEFSALFDGATY